MTPAQMKRLATQCEEFNRQAEQFAAMGRQLSIARDILVGSIRDTGILKDTAESMVSKLKFEVTMPEPDLDDEPQDAGRQDSGDAEGFADPAKAA